MGQKVKPARIAVVVSSMVLMGGYVYYRSIGQVAPLTTVIESGRSVVWHPSTQPSQELILGTVNMSGSAAPSSMQINRSMLGSSKGTVIFYKTEKSPTEQESERAIMPGSKSAPIVSPRPATRPPPP